MKLNLEQLKNRREWEAAGFRLPDFDVEAMRRRTWENPRWLHFGAGNLFRAVPAAAAQNMLDAGTADTGIIVCEDTDGDLIDLIWRPHDDLSVLVVPRPDGGYDKRVLASVAGSLRTDGRCPADDRTLESLFVRPGLQMVSFTITAKGYRLRNGGGAWFPWIRRDMDGEPEDARTPMGHLTYLLLKRFEACAAPLALVSMDNLPHGGEHLRNALLDIAGVWLFRGRVTQDFYDYLSDGTRLSFPLTAVDRITPRPTPAIAKALRAGGLEISEPVPTPRGYRAAEFVPTEPVCYAILEDSFPGGRPDLAAGGFRMTDRETVRRFSRMKACSCLSPVRTELALLGRLLGYQTLSEAIADPDLRLLSERLALKEGLPAAENPGIISPERYAEEAIQVRLSDPCLSDTASRVATDTSLKLPVRFGETIRYYADGCGVQDLKAVPFVLAAYLRYLMGLDDDLRAFEPSPDPQLETLREKLNDARFGADYSQRGIIQPLMRDESLWGVDLSKTGLDESVGHWFDRMLEGRGAVREALKDVLKPQEEKTTGNLQ
ncbi:MAG: mannitol dehydrogenase family protein [Clostridia bacterium]|nr:mannitol dehydrogenase family protein [Clostridia bacterium]